MQPLNTINEGAYPEGWNLLSGVLICCRSCVEVRGRVLHWTLTCFVAEFERERDMRYLLCPIIVIVYITNNGCLRESDDGINNPSSDDMIDVTNCTFWNQLSDDVAATVDSKGEREEPLSLATMKESRLFREVVRRASTADLRTMARQNRYPLVKLVAFRVAQQQSRDDGDHVRETQIAVDIILSNDCATLSIYASVLFYVKNFLRGDSGKDVLAHIRTTDIGDPSNVYLLLHLCDTTMLHELFHERRQVLEQPLLAILLGHLYDDAKDRHVKPTKEMEDELQNYVRNSGFPLLIYGTYSDASNNDAYRAALERCLSDEVLRDTDLLYLIIARRDFIGQNIDVDRLPTSRRRRRFIKIVLMRDP